MVSASVPRSVLLSWVAPLSVIIWASAILFALIKHRPATLSKPLWQFSDVLNLGNLALCFAGSLFPLVLTVTWSINSNNLLLDTLREILSSGRIVPVKSALIALAVSDLAMAPLAEEWLFRGVIQSKVTSWVGPTWSILATSAVWALLHPWSLRGIIGLFGMGVILGALSYRSKSLMLCLVAHFINNLVAVLAMIYSSTYPT